MEPENSPTILIPKKNVILDASVLTALMNCETYLNYRYNMNLIPIAGKGNPLDAGSLVHLILQEYNRSLIAGKNRSDSIQIGMQAGHTFYTTESTNIPEENVKGDRGQLKEIGYNYIVSTMEQYFDRWKNSHWTPIEAEQVVGHIIYEDDEIRILYKAKIDLMVDTYQDGICPVDYKTMKQKRDALSLNNQFRGQAILTKARTVYIEKIGWQSSLKPEDKFTRQPMSFSAAILAEQIETIVYYAKTLIALKEGNYYPQRFTYCDKWGGCLFRYVCEADPGNRQRMIDQHFIENPDGPWDPGNEKQKDED